ncbi:hypothetical protein Salmuc_01900 [Salipiger mucosus DSM 16094]|uniref:Uncharacterized protein n=1 Tax=Salipiger mucosus DSM 16094 TaxID=1123237 RepID=S9R1H4_9RHOB|nr:hypothetical protein Salmuc_01900 [Salipiger mucosus DSM 16094]
MSLWPEFRHAGRRLQTPEGRFGLPRAPPACQFSRKGGCK